MRLSVSLACDIENSDDLAQGSKFGSFVQSAADSSGNGISGCAPIGCIMAMQSLTYIGYSECELPQSSTTGQGGAGNVASALGARVESCLRPMCSPPLRTSYPSFRAALQLRRPWESLPWSLIHPSNIPTMQPGIPTDDCPGPTRHRSVAAGTNCGQSIHRQPNHSRQRFQSDTL